MRRVGEADVVKEVEGWGRLDEKGMKRETKRLVSKLNKMLRKRPWQPDKGTVSTTTSSRPFPLGCVSQNSTAAC